VSAPFGGGFVLFYHAGRDTPAAADSYALLVRPHPDIAGALTARAGTRRPAARPPASLTGVLNKGRQLLAERPGILLVQIDLILGATDPNRTVSSAGPPSRSSSSVTVTFVAIPASIYGDGTLAR
jgi:hypothetical protein